MRREAALPGTLSIDLLDRTAAVARRALEQILLPHDLTLDAWRVLHALCVQGPQSMRPLGDMTGTTAPTLTRIVDRLVARSLVYRNVDPGDRRRLLVHASGRGRALQKDLQEPLREAESAALAPLSHEEVRTLRDLLERLT